MPTMGALRWVAALGAVEGGVTKAEDTTVRPDQPVAVPVGGGGDARDRVR